MESLPNEILLYIADKCDMRGRKSLASTNYNLRALIWRNLPLFVAHRRQFLDTIAQINSIDYTILHMQHTIQKSISFRIYKRFGKYARICYLSFIPTVYKKHKTDNISCICIAGIYGECIALYNNHIQYDYTIYGGTYSLYYNFALGKMTIYQICDGLTILYDNCTYYFVHKN